MSVPPRPTERSPEGLAAALPWMVARIRALLPRRTDLTAMGRRPRKDVVAGLTVGVVALPLALAFGISSGLGAQAGLVTAIVAGVVAALFGGSHVQVSGPTGAMTVVLLPIFAAHGISGVLVVGVLAGLALIGMAIAGLGRYITYLPLPVIEGFTLGIAVIIGLQQVPAALGIAPKGEGVLAVAGHAVIAWVSAPQWWPAGIAAGVAAGMLLIGRFRPAVPASLLAIVATTVLVGWAHLPLATIGPLPSGLPVPSIPTVGWVDLRSLVLPALAVAALGALESLLSAAVSDAMSVSERHDPDRELFGQGMANLVSPLFGGMPATAAIARTAVNVRSGATSRLSSIVHAVALLVVVLALGPVVSHIPLAALAGVLIATAIRMVEVSSLRALLRSSRSEGIVIGLVALATVVVDLVTAVLLGIVTAGAFALRSFAKTTQLVEVSIEGPDADDEAAALMDEHIVAYRLDGPLFFGGAHHALLELSELSDVRVVILRMSRVATQDTTGSAVLRDTIEQLERRGTRVLLSGVPLQHAPMLEALGVYDSLAHERHLFATTPEAIAHARVHAGRIPHQG